jgi:hypothetical protein
MVRNDRKGKYEIAALHSQSFIPLAMTGKEKIAPSLS